MGTFSLSFLSEKDFVARAPLFFLILQRFIFFVSLPLSLEEGQSGSLDVSGLVSFGPALGRRLPFPPPRPGLPLPRIGR